MFYFVTGLLLGVGFVEEGLWPVVVLGMALVVAVSKETVTWQRALLAGLVIGLVKFGLVLGWFFSLYPLDWLGLTPGVGQFIFILLYYLPSVLCLSLGMAFFFVVCHYLRVKISDPASLWLLPIVWVIAEYMGSLLFSVYTLGPGSYLNFGFTYGFSGYLLSGHGLLSSVAEWGGVSTLSFIVAMVGVVLYKFPLKTKALVFLFLFATVFVPQESYQVTNQVVAVVETSFSADLDWDYDTYREVSIEAFASAAETGADIIVLPENFHLTAYFGTPEKTLVYISSLVTDKIVVVDTARTQTKEGTYLRSYTYDLSSNSIYTEDKRYLVPQGEYIPYVYRALIKAVDTTGELGRSLSQIDYSVGEKGIGDRPKHLPQILFCYSESDLSALSGDASLVVNPVSHAWFHTPTMLWVQQDMMLRLQAVRNNVAIVRSANEAESRVYLPNGSLVELKEVGKGNKWRVLVTNI